MTIFSKGAKIRGNSTKATVHEFILGDDDHHFSMYFVNKVMGPEMPSDNQDVVNIADNCVEHSSYGKNVGVHILFTTYSSSHNLIPFV